MDVLSSDVKPKISSLISTWPKAQGVRRGAHGAGLWGMRYKESMERTCCDG